MISSTFGAPLGGTTFAGQQGLDCSAPRLMTPPNAGGGAGTYFPSMVVVALGEQVAVAACCAFASAAVSTNVRKTIAIRTNRGNNTGLFDISQFLRVIRTDVSK